jgi:predicted alpha/beta superfamily hydrolase
VRFWKAQGKRISEICSSLQLLMMCRVLAFYIIASLSLPSIAAIEIGEVLSFKSNVLNEERRIYVSLPKSYATSERSYGLYLTLDARVMFTPAAAMMNSFSSSGATPEMIVVSIENTQRWRDLTPTHDNNWPTSGGGENFLSFVESELIPYLEDRFRLSGYRVLSGHSLGGLMVLHSHAMNPKLFDAYVAMSPTTRWSPDLIEDWQQQLVKTRNLNASTKLYVCLADEWQDETSLHAYLEFLQAQTHLNLALRFDSFAETDDHHSVRVPAELAAMRFVFEDYRLRSADFYQSSNEDISAFYQAAAQQYKQAIELDVMSLTNAAYWGLRNKALQERAIELFTWATERWPNDAYAWASLGEGYERISDLDSALEALRKAKTTGLKTGFTQMPYIEAILRRVESQHQVAH